MPTKANGSFSGEIRVASRIIDYLSSGLYPSPAACLKELVNNSYDADATEVHIFVKPDADRIIIEDNGSGMSREQFQHHFERVSESHKRDDSELTPRGRKKIGKIGIGFIAANELCDEMEIFTTQKGSQELLHIRISFLAMRESFVERRRDGGDFVKGDYRGTVAPIDSASHYTKLFLNGVRGEARDILASARAQGDATPIASLYGLAPTSLRALLTSERLHSWDQLDRYSVTMTQIALNVPVAYHDLWLPAQLLTQVRDITHRAAAPSFAVFYDGSEMRKPIVLGSSGSKTMLRRFAFEGKHVAAMGYFFVQRGVLRPQELNGVLIRIRETAVGEHDRGFMGFPTSEGTLFQRWISSELYADDRLEEALNIDRKTLRVTHPAFVELQNAVHDFMSDLLKEVRDVLYKEPADARKTETARQSLKSIESAIHTSVGRTDRGAAKQLVTEWRNLAISKRGPAKLNHRYNTQELFQVVLEVAEEVLPAKLLGRFVRELTSRLAR